MVNQPDEQGYDLTISELEERANRKSGPGVTGGEVTKRTIRYYVKEGVLDPPEGKGGGARYGEKHLLQLEFIRLLQKYRQTISEIKGELALLDTPQKLRSAIREIEKKEGGGPGVRRGRVRDFEGWLSGMIPAKTSERQEVLSARTMPFRSGSYSFRAIQEGRKEKPPGQQGLGGEVKHSVIPAEGTSWKRLEIADGLEINLRSDVERRYAQIIRELAEKLQEEKEEKGI